MTSDTSCKRKLLESKIREMRGEQRGREDCVTFKIRGYYSEQRSKIRERGYDSVGTRRRDALLEEMIFQPVEEDEE